MKNQSIDLIFPSQIQIAQQLQQIQFKQIKCIKGNKSTHACLNKNCQKYAFVCFDESCQCMQQHRRCLNVYIKSLKNSLLSKIISLEQFSKQICQKIDQTINHLSILRQNVQAKLKTDFIYYGLSASEVLFIKSLETGNVKQMTGKKIWQAHLNMQPPLQEVKASEEFLKSANQMWKKYHQQTVKCVNHFQQKLEDFRSTYTHETVSKQIKYPLETIFIDSKIIKSTQQKYKICKFFQKRNIKTSNLIYRASSNKFQVDSFHQNCNGIPNTLKICQTGFVKIIGGYTPLAWENLSELNGLFRENDFDETKDRTGSSFIFSLTNNHKFKLQNQKLAIFQDETFGPAFGNVNLDFFISNKANGSAQSYANINQSYINQNYKFGEQSSWQKFSGSPKGYNFKIKEWQVWQLQFSP